MDYQNVNYVNLIKIRSTPFENNSKQIWQTHSDYFDNIQLISNKNDRDFISDIVQQRVIIMT